MKWPGPGEIEGRCGLPGWFDARVVDGVDLSARAARGIDLAHGPDAGFLFGGDRFADGGMRCGSRSAVRDGMATLTSLVPHVIDELSGLEEV